MSIRTTYLEIYSIAPPPSRDYYGLRVYEDEVILYHWRISHGPHKIPFTHICNYIDWKSDKSLQNEIKEIFGEPWLQYTNDILNRKSLLTLPKNLIIKLLRYLSPSNIFKLFLLCRAAHKILNSDRVWELLCRRIKSDSWTTRDEKYGMAYGWKQLYKETNDIEKYLGSNETSKFDMSNVEMKSQQKISSHRKPLPKPQLEIIRTMSAGKKTIPTNSKTKIQPRNRDKIFYDEAKGISTHLDDKVNGKKSFLNIVNLQADDLKITSKTKPTMNSLEAKVSKKNMTDKQKISKFTTASKLSFPKTKTNNYERVRMSRSTILSPKSHTAVDYLTLKSDEIPLDELVEHTIEEFDKPNKMLECTYNWLNDISPPEEQSVCNESARNYSTSFLSNEYKAARLLGNSRYSLNPSQISTKIDELSAWQAAKLKALKASEALQSSTSTEKISSSYSTKSISRIRKNI